MVGTFVAKRLSSKTPPRRLGSGVSVAAGQDFTECPGFVAFWRWSQPDDARLHRALWLPDDAIARLWCVLSRKAEMHGDVLPLVCGSIFSAEDPTLRLGLRMREYGKGQTIPRSQHAEKCSTAQAQKCDISKRAAGSLRASQETKFVLFPSCECRCLSRSHYLDYPSDHIPPLAPA